jgi:hypothetical protein
LQAFPAVAEKESLATAQHELVRVPLIATHPLCFHRQATKATGTGAADMIDSILALHGRTSSSSNPIGNSMDEM